MLTLFLSKFGVIAAVIMAAIAGAFGLFKAGSSIGSAKAKADAATTNAAVAVAQVEQNAAQMQQTMKDASDVQAQTASLDRNAIADELQQFQREAPADSNAGVPASNPKAD